MKTIPPRCPEPEGGRQYWRSLEQLAETAEFQEWVAREFPAGASECSDPVTRRQFMKLMSASFIFAGLGLSGCRRPEETIYPFSRLPENYTHGQAVYYATARPIRNQVIPLLVKSHEGRPTKVEGNPQHPDGQGATDAHTQASLLNLYDPDRAQRFTQRGSDVTRAAALDLLAKLSKGQAAAGGRGLSLLLDQDGSPSRERLLEALRKKYPEARFYEYEPVDFNIRRTSATTAFGQPVEPVYRFEQARVIVSLDADFLGTEAGSWRFIRGFAKGRSADQPKAGMSRLYMVEALLSLTGANADHRLRLPASLIAALATRLAAIVLGGVESAEARSFAASLNARINKADLEKIGVAAGQDAPGWIERWVDGCARDLLANRGRSLVCAGYRQPAAVHALAHWLNALLGNVGQTVDYRSVKAGNQGTIAELAQALQRGEVDTLVIVGGNPAYNAPADLEWEKSQRRAKTVIRLGYYEDETFASCDWHFPAAHYLESWGDGRSPDGALVAMQPLIDPLFGGMTGLEFLARLGGFEKTSAYEIVRATFQALSPGGNFEEAWKKFLHDGYLADSGKKAAAPVVPDWKAGEGILTGLQPVSVPSAQKLEVVWHLDYSLDDGRYNNNGWLQEMPDPITKITWDNAVLISRKTAAELKVKNHEEVEVTLGSRRVRGPVWIQPGLADYTLGLALGYGRRRTGRVGNQAGFDCYPLRSSAALHCAAGATVKATGARSELVCTQDHWSMEGRPIIREATLKQYEEQPDFLQRLNLEVPPGGQPLYPNPLDKAREKALHQWGMVIDLNSCVGCSACVMACQSENNVPIVGKEQVGKGREMHWLRIDRYYTADPLLAQDRNTMRPESEQAAEHWIDNAQVIQQPMMCQHCESAPCESVCPVNATVHDEEGLNVMAYNRCVGTRYCSNNCPYKVRRFNFFDYNKRPFQNHQLYLGPLAKKPEDELELVKLAKNPDVSVRMRGVMEKCTYCVQRIEQAKIAQKIQAGPSGNVEVADGAIRTACEQACPAQAIVFGNVADPNSRVARLKKNQRSYSVLEFLNTKPRTTYLARIRNPNPAMPDYYEVPPSTREFEAGNGTHEPGGHAGSEPAQDHSHPKGSH